MKRQIPILLLVHYFIAHASAGPVKPTITHFNKLTRQYCGPWRRIESLANNGERRGITSATRVHLAIGINGRKRRNSMTIHPKYLCFISRTLIPCNSKISLPPSHHEQQVGSPFNRSTPLYASRSGSINSGEKKQKQMSKHSKKIATTKVKNGKKSNNATVNGNKFQQMRKSEIDDLVRGRNCCFFI
jgi:hypothetical protein